MKQIDTTKSADAVAAESGISMKICTYAITKDVPSEIKFSDNLPRFIGLNELLVNPDLIWGIYGTLSIKSANTYASIDANNLKKKMYPVDFYMKINIDQLTSQIISRETAINSGLFHFDRLEVDYKRSILDEMIGYCAQMYGVTEQSLRVQYPVSTSLSDLLRDKPMLVHRFMAENPCAKMCIQFVRLSGGLSLRIGTVRRDVEKSWLEVRNHDIRAIV